MTDYAAQTMNARNPLARYAHRSRLRHSIALAKNMIALGRILDYGCGSGVFITEINRLSKGIAYGYEPYMDERSCEGLPIYSDFSDITRHGPFGTITLFETIEHLTDEELKEFLARASDLLVPDGSILISAPIEIGPSLFLKEMNRTVLRSKKPEYRLKEFIQAALIGIPARRAGNIKISHRGFDFRAAIASLENHGWIVELLGFSPFPFLGWYGNSQVFLRAKKLRHSGPLPSHPHSSPPSADLRE